MSLIFKVNGISVNLLLSLFFTGIPFPIIVAWAMGKLYYDNEK